MYGSPLLWLVRRDTTGGEPNAHVRAGSDQPSKRRIRGRIFRISGERTYAISSSRSRRWFGTGNGLAGAIVAMVVGLISMVLGGLALARSRRTADRLTG